MFRHDHLALRLLRLQPLEEWLHRGKSFALVFPKGGLGTFVCATIRHRLAPGDVLAITDLQGGKICAADGAELVFSSFAFSLEHLYPLFGNDEMSLLHDVTEIFKTPRLYPASSPLAQECHRLLAAAPAQHQMDHRGQLLRVVTAILTVEFRNARHQRGRSVSAGEHMIEVLEKLLITDIMDLSVGELADKLHCSSRHLNRLFHQYFGLSVAALKMEMRLIKAITLLRDRNTKVIHVAEQCGFNHLGLFNSCFKHRFGVSPGRWRNANQPVNARPADPIHIARLCQMQTVGLCPWASEQPGAAPAGPKTASKNRSSRTPAHSLLGSPTPQFKNGAVAAARAKLATIMSEKIEAASSPIPHEDAGL
jgi:AraC-like DNA-binding protein